MTRLLRGQREGEERADKEKIKKKRNGPEHETVAMLKDVHRELAVREGDGVERKEGEDEFELLSFGLVFLCPFGVLRGEACKGPLSVACAKEEGRKEGCVTHIA